MSAPIQAVRLVPDGEGGAGVEGVLDFASVSPLLPAGAALIQAKGRRGGRVAIDLGGVTSANSAGLALLLEWMDLARSRQVTLEYRNLPESLARIAEFSNLQSLLPVAAPGF
jgi:phospholipid transport system transporter-binding protein